MNQGLTIVPVWQRFYRCMTCGMEYKAWGFDGDTPPSPAPRCPSNSKHDEPAHDGDDQVYLVKDDRGVYVQSVPGSSGESPLAGGARYWESIEDAQDYVCCRVKNKVAIVHVQIDLRLTQRQRDALRLMGLHGQFGAVIPADVERSLLKEGLITTTATWVTSTRRRRKRPLRGPASLTWKGHYVASLLPENREK